MSAFELRRVSKSKAKKDITLFLTKKHQEGKFEVSLLDLILELKLPGEQVEEIMSEFLKRKRIKEL